MPRDPNTALPQPIFSETSVSQDPTAFITPHPSDTAQFNALGNLLKKDVVSFETSRVSAGDLFTLREALGARGAPTVKQIKTAGKIVFHAVGDTGASNAAKFANEIRVADQLTMDCRAANAANRPSFFFHLGDVVYNFGESRYYFDQFYEPYRNYPVPIFAIPGNHDSFVIPNTPPSEAPLTIFSRNFCAPSPMVTPEAGSMHRTAMTQPGVYFTLDAPFVRVIGLFSNSLEDPGLISSEKGRWPGVPDVQLDYLAAQLKRIKTEKYTGAVIVATHHPPFTYSPPPRMEGSGGNHSGSTAMLGEIDEICKKQGVYPHAFLAGHAHNYQRFERVVRFGGKDIEVPFVVCGDGGHNVNRIVQGRNGQPATEPQFNTTVDHLDRKPVVQSKGLKLKAYDDDSYGYLRITVDKKKMKIGFHQVAITRLPQSRADVVTVDLATHRTVAT
jgi:calcineurin-like phosphoesterase family protein